MIQRKPFDIGPFIDFLTSEGLRHTTADLYTRYVRPGINAGVDPADLEAFESYVVKLSPPTQAVRRTAWRWWQKFKGLPLQPDARSTEDRPSKQGGVDTAELPFIRFGEWLPRARGLSPNSVHVYVSTVRKAVKAVGTNPSREALDAFLRDQGGSYQARFQTIWRRWEEYSREAGQPVAVLEPAHGVPDDVCFALHYLTVHVGIQLVHLRTLRWDDLHESAQGQGFDVRFLPDPKPGRYYRQCLDNVPVIETLRTWSLPFDTTAFVAPSTRGGTTQFSRAEIQGAVARGALLAESGHVLSGRRTAVPLVQGGERPALGAPWAGLEVPD